MFAFLTSEVWDVEIKKHLGLKQFAIMHGANRLFGLVNCEDVGISPYRRVIDHLPKFFWGFFCDF